MNILFVCQYNRRRSQIAESYFKNINKSKNLKAKSAGIFKGQDNKIEDIQRGKKFGLKIRKIPQAISSELLKWQNLTVIVASKVPKKIFWRSKKYGKKVIKWYIGDEYVKTDEDYKKLVDKIKQKVDKLYKKINLK